MFQVVVTAVTVHQPRDVSIVGQPRRHYWRYIGKQPLPELRHGLQQGLAAQMASGRQIALLPEPSLVQLR